MANSPDVILVHGAWADGSSWAKVIPLLAARGHSVTAVQLPLTSLGDDVATVKRAIALASGPIVMAGHSYGGAVISEAGNDPKVETLVYIAAFAPDGGESAGSLGASVEPAPLCRYLVATNDRAIPPALQRRMAKRLNAAVVEVASSHVAMLSHPKEVASLIAG